MIEKKLFKQQNLQQNCSGVVKISIQSKQMQQRSNSSKKLAQPIQIGTCILGRKTLQKKCCYQFDNKKLNNGAKLIKKSAIIQGLHSIAKCFNSSDTKTAEKSWQAQTQRLQRTLAAGWKTWKFQNSVFKTKILIFFF